MQDHEASSDDQNRDDDFLPGDWSDDQPGGPTISDDFAARTLARVLADRALIRAEAARVDDVEIPRALLDAYEVPAVSADFAARTANRIAAAKDADLQQLLASYESPEPTEDFVDRTLLALKVERSPLRLVSQPAEGNPTVPTDAPHRVEPAGQAESRAVSSWSWAAFVVATAAAILVTFWPFGDSSPIQPRISVLEAAFEGAVVEQTHSPASWSTDLAQLAAIEADDLVFHAPAGERTLSIFEARRQR